MIINKNNTISAIILAGGNSQRARTKGKLKQFSKINEKLLIEYSLDVITKCNFIREIIVVVPKGIAPEKVLDKYKIKVTEGGENRRGSTLRGLEMILKEKITPGYVIIHDAARPMISKKMIESVFKEAIKYGASTVGIPAIDLLFEVDKDMIKKAYNKHNFYYGFTPQCFKFKDILGAHLHANKIKLIGDYDNIELLKLYKNKTPVKIIDKFYPNIKFTYKEDKNILKYLLH